MTEVDKDGKIFVGKGEKTALLSLAFANRHGLVTGATGTGKTVTLQVLAEGLSRAGVPVFAADIKGDLSGISAVGEAKEALVTRAKDLGFDYQPDEFPAVFWDVFGAQGHPVRATISEMGPLLLSRMMDLNDVQEGVLNIAFRVADEQGLLLLDLKDLRAMLGYLAEHAAELTTQYGNVTKATIGTIQRQLLVLENQGGAKFFGEPALALKDFMRTDSDGRGIVNILVADKLMENPRLYATFLLWLLSELFEQMPEVGDLDKPKLVFFFDEAHLLFNDAPKALLDKIEQVVRLIRSKGVGVYFVTQNPIDVPDKVLGQLGNRVQHALRAFTPRDQKAVAAAAQTFRPNPKARHRPGHHGARQGRGAGVVPRRQRHAGDGRARHDPAAVGAHRTDHAGGARRDPGQEPGEGQVRRHGRRRVGLRGVAEASAAERPAGRAGRGARGRRTAGRSRRDARRHLRHQPAARHAADARPDHGARGHPHGDQPRRRPDRRRSRQIAGRLDGRFGRPRHRARRAWRHSAALSHSL